MDKVLAKKFLKYAPDPTEYTYEEIIDNFLYLIDSDEKYIEKDLNKKGECIEWSELDQVYEDTLYTWALVIEKTKNGIVANIHTLGTWAPTRFSESPDFKIKRDTEEKMYVGEFESLKDLYDYLNDLLK